MEDVKTADLLPCPFCGSKAELISRHGTAVICTNDQCVIHTDTPIPFNFYGHRETAIDAWNTRAAAPAPLPGGLERDRDIVEGVRARCERESKTEATDALRHLRAEEAMSLAALLGSRPAQEPVVPTEQAEGAVVDLRTIRDWLDGLSSADLDEAVADGGVNAGMVYQQEAREFSGRLSRILSHQAPTPASVSPGRSAASAPNLDAGVVGDLVEALTGMLKLADALTGDHVAEGVHTGLRKGSDAKDAHALWKAISASDTSAWSDACGFFADSMTDDYCGFGRQITQARAALAKHATEGTGEVWIGWAGGSDPLTGDGHYVEIRHRNGKECVIRRSIADWSHDGGPADIVAYRLIATQGTGGVDA